MKDKLKQYMKDNGINQKQLASLLGITEGHLSRVLSGHKKAGAETVEKYYKLPGIPEKEIISRVRETVNQLWMDDDISGHAAKKILAEIHPGD